MRVHVPRGAYELLSEVRIGRIEFDVVVVPALGVPRADSVLHASCHAHVACRVWWKIHARCAESRPARRAGRRAAAWSAACSSRIHRVGAAAHSESPPAAAPFSATLRSRMRCFFFSFFSRWYLVVRYEMEAVVRYNTVPVALARLVCSACSRLGEPWHAPSLRSRGADVGRGEPSASADIGRGEPSRGADACLAPAAARAHLSWHANAGDVRPRRGARASEGADGSALSHIHRGTGVHMGSPPHGTGPCLGGRVPRGAGELHGVGNEAHVDDLRGRCWAAGLVLAAGGDRGRSSLTLASCWSAGTAVHADT